MADAPNEQTDEVVVQGTTWPDPELFLAGRFGLSGEIEPLGTEPPSFLVRYDEVVSRLDFCQEPESAQQFEAQAALLLHMHPETGRIEGPQPIEGIDGTFVCAYDASEEHAGGYARVCAFPTGLPAPIVLEPAVLGSFAARLIRDLSAACEDSRTEEATPLRSSADLRQAGPLVVALLRDVPDPVVRDPIAKAMVTALRRIQPLGQDLRSQLIHHAPIGQELVGDVRDGRWQPTGFNDPESLGEGWIVASLAAVCADLMVKGIANPMSILPAVTAFNAELSLTEPELKALWPLIVIRIGLGLADAERRLADEVDDGGDISRLRDRFQLATTFPTALMEAAIRDAVDWPVADLPELGLLLPEVDPTHIRLVDLSTASTAFAEGNWQDPEIDWRLLARIAWDTKMAATRFGEYRLSRSHAHLGAETENHALHVDLCVPAGTVAIAPFGGMVQLSDGRIVLSSREVCLHIEGLDTILTDGSALFAGDRLGVVSGAEGSVGGLRIRLSREAMTVPPLFVAPRDVGLWRQIALSPSLILGTNVDAPSSFPEGYVRGWREHIFDAKGRSFLDFSGAAGLLGHGHAGLAETAYQQWMLLNGHSGTAAETDFQAALLQRLPGDLDTVVALTTETLAIDVAQQLGERQFSGDEDPVVADERRSGFYRNGRSFWRFEEDERQPDIVVTGSPVPGEPLAAVIVSSKALPEDLQLPQPDAGMVACRLGAFVIDALDDAALRDQLSNAATHLDERLAWLVSQSDGRLTCAGEGLAYELMMPAGDAPRIAEDLLQEGIILSNLDDERLMVLPPLCTTPASIDYLVDRLANLLGIVVVDTSDITKSPEISKADLPTDEVLPI